MASSRRSARIAGACFLISNVAFLVGAAVLVEPVFTSADFLSLATANRGQVVLGVLLELVNAFAYLGMSVIMFSALRSRLEALALGYVGIRVIEFVTQMLADISALQIVDLSREFVAAGAPVGSQFQTMGMLLLSDREWSFQMLNIAFCTSALVLYFMLYRTRLVPRFISVWGLVAAVLILISTVLDWFGIGLGTALGVVTGLPMLLNELFFGVWLIVKGFSPSAERA